MVGRRDTILAALGVGRLSWSEGERMATPDSSIYDLASLTKVMATTTAVMLLVDDGRIALDVPVAQYLPSFGVADPTGAKRRVTVADLLAHRSGLPAGRNLWRLTTSPAAARTLVLETPLERHPGGAVVYSDLGADVLAFAIEAVTGEPMDSLLARRIWQPLGMWETRSNPPASWAPRIAPTEVTPPRGYRLRGEVHDENAYALGGSAGHAGLFGTAADVARYAQLLLNGGMWNGRRLLSDTVIARFTRRVAGTRALGWDTCAPDSTCGSLMGPTAFGHTGFTGTSLWIDPTRDLFIIVLANRVHAPRAPRPARVMHDVRADAADAAVLALDPAKARSIAWRTAERDGWGSRPPARRTRGGPGKMSARAQRAAAARRSAAKTSKAPKSAKSAKPTKPAKSTRSAKSRSTTRARSPQTGRGDGSRD